MNSEELHPNNQSCVLNSEEGIKTDMIHDGLSLEPSALDVQLLGSLQTLGSTKA